MFKEQVILKNGYSIVDSVALSNRKNQMYSRKIVLDKNEFEIKSMLDHYPRFSKRIVEKVKNLMACVKSCEFYGHLAQFDTKDYARSEKNLQTFESSLEELFVWIFEMQKKPKPFDIFKNIVSQKTIEKLVKLKVVKSDGAPFINWALLFDENDEIKPHILSIIENFDSKKEIQIFKSPLHTEAEWAELVYKAKQEYMPKIVLQEKIDAINQIYGLGCDGMGYEVGNIDYYFKIVNPFGDGKIYAILGRTGAASCGIGSFMDCREFENEEHYNSFFENHENFDEFEQAETLCNYEINRNDYDSLLDKVSRGNNNIFTSLGKSDLYPDIMRVEVCKEPIGIESILKSADAKFSATKFKPLVFENEIHLFGEQIFPTIYQLE